jgi:hypothetical protein
MAVYPSLPGVTFVTVPFTVKIPGFDVKLPADGFLQEKMNNRSEKAVTDLIMCETTLDKRKANSHAGQTGKMEAGLVFPGYEVFINDLLLSIGRLTDVLCEYPVFLFWSSKCL